MRLESNLWEKKNKNNQTYVKVIFSQILPGDPDKQNESQFGWWINNTPSPDRSTGVRTEKWHYFFFYLSYDCSKLIAGTINGCWLEAASNIPFWQQDKNGSKKSVTVRIVRLFGLLANKGPPATAELRLDL